jgi:hypothetical protein
MIRSKNISLNNAIEGVSASARRKAFRHKLPVAISENGKTILVYPDGSRKPFTKQALQALKYART